MTNARLLPSFRGWVAFRCGKALRTKTGAVKVFQTKEAAIRAAKQSRAGAR